jgi:hypothetical protein
VRIALLPGGSVEYTEDHTGGHAIYAIAQHLAGGT